MKTPRDILLARHQAANSRLDEIRRAAVRDLRSPETKHQSSTVFGSWLLRNSQNLWREWIQPRPQAWAAVAAMWVLIFALKLSTHETAHSTARKTAASPEMLAEVRQQQRLFAELAGLANPRLAVPAKAAPARPRSDRRLRIPIG